MIDQPISPAVKMTTGSQGTNSSVLSCMALSMLCEAM